MDVVWFGRWELLSLSLSLLSTPLCVNISASCVCFVYRVPRVLPSQLLPDGQRLPSVSAAGGAQREDGAQEHGGAGGRGRWAVTAETLRATENEHNATMIVVTDHLSLPFQSSQT